MPSLHLPRAAALLACLLCLLMPARAQQGPPFVNPPSVTSSGGQLNVTLSINPATVNVAGVQFQTNVYNSLYAPPTLRVRRGDVIRLKLVNNISTGQTTNLHYHGFSVSPLAPADNIFLSIPPQGGVYNYVINMPANHAQGMFWYHPHPHGISEPQVLGGMSGGMIVEGLLESNYPEFAGITERIMLLKDAELTLPATSPCKPQDPDAKIKTVNGLCNPTINIRPGEAQLWRMGNIGADAYFNLQLQGVTMYVIAVDGNATTQPVPVSNFLLPPGARVEAIVFGPPAGTYQFKSLVVDTGPQGDPNPEVPVATVVSSGQQVRNLALLRRIRRLAARPPAPPTPARVRALPLTGRRQFTFDENGAGDKFCINNCMYDMSRVDTRVTVGDVEEWTLLNTTGEVHAFHIHQLDFLVTEINGVPQNPTGLQDTVNLPYKNQTTGKAGEVKIIVPFTNPAIVGEFVYHCHILEHEDGGMMANIVVLPPPGRQRRALEARLRADAQRRGHAGHAQPQSARPCVPCVLMQR